MQNQIQKFSFNNQSLQIIIKNNQAWFIASEVANLLGYLKASDLTRILDDDEKDTHNMRTLGGNQDVSIINESGFYHAAFKSRKPEVKPFRKWVTSEVLPQIRKTGGYTIPTTKKALPNGLTIEQQDEIKKLHRELVQAAPKEMQAKLAIMLWSSIKSKFGVSYKEVPSEQYAEVLSVMARVAVEQQNTTLHGEVLDKLPTQTPPAYNQQVFEMVARLATYTKKWRNFQKMVCRNPENPKIQAILNEITYSYSVNPNQAGFLFLFKPDVDNHLKEAVDWLHSQSQVIDDVDVVA